MVMQKKEQHLVNRKFDCHLRMYVMNGEYVKRRESEKGNHEQKEILTLKCVPIEC